MAHPFRELEIGSKLPIAKEKGCFSVVIEPGFASSRYSHLYSLRLKRPGQCRPSTAVCSLNRYEHVVNSSVLSETYYSNVLDGEKGVSSLTDISQSTPKVSIPSLPDEDNGDDVAPISSCFWEWRPKLNVHYKTSGSGNVDSPPILFLPGFGVGSFHYDKQLKDLGRDYRAWALDFLGQGMSLPHEDPTLRSKDGNKYMLAGQNDPWGFGDESETWAKELVYSVDLWKDQVQSFVEETTQHPAAAASFASIMFAPRGQLSFKEALSRCQMNNIPICLTYGKEDPWVMPIFGLWVKKQVPDAPYYEISPAGHCPHDEVPEVVNFLLRGWIKNLESDGSVVLPLLDDPKNADYGVTKDLEFSRQGSIKSVRVHFHGSKFSVWNWLSSQFKPLFKSMEYLVSRGVEDVSA
ncbi:hypothetical protein DH2020_002849 [Rehmannia glutinosa]|uniref:Pheophytinase n=1 Tax=Rehmannia glutinosa TaxID=99300 RepID=A0ABR0XUX4_REHGL